jgi:hypothetical protein
LFVAHPNLVIRAEEPPPNFNNLRDIAACRPLAEYEDEEWVEKYLITLVSAIVRSAREQGTNTWPRLSSGALYEIEHQLERE